MEHPRTDHLPQNPYTRFIPFYIRFTERAGNNFRMTGREVAKLLGHTAVVKSKGKDKDKVKIKKNKDKDKIK